MALTNLYTGEARRQTIEHLDAGGTAIPHVSLEEVRYILRNKQSGETLLRFKKNAPTGWKSLTQEADAGKYTFEVEENETKTWKAGTVILEWYIKVTDANYQDGFKPMGFYELWTVIESNYAEE